MALYQYFPAIDHNITILTLYTLTNIRKLFIILIFKGIVDLPLAKGIKTYLANQILLLQVLLF